MSTPHAPRDINGGAGKHVASSIPVKTGNPVLDANLYDLAQRYSKGEKAESILQLLSSVMSLAESDLLLHDAEMMNRALDELLRAEKLFAPYNHHHKVTCFGSARIQAQTPAYQLAVDFSRRMTEHGWMTITGGGPGIMQASNEGAGREYSFGLNITLPFEQSANPVVHGSDKMMDFYYFFTRKLNLVKQTDALVAFPGGFGTMDEIYEAITLMQTGKCTIFPIVLLDAPGDFFWSRWLNFVEKELLNEGLISPEDLSLLYLTKSAEDAACHILHFFSTFHSYYYEGNQLTIRLNAPLEAQKLEQIRAEYKDMMPEDDLSQSAHGEGEPEASLAHKPRLSFTYALRNFSRLRELIDDING